MGAGWSCPARLRRARARSDRGRSWTFVGEGGRFASSNHGGGSGAGQAGTRDDQRDSDDPYADGTTDVTADGRRRTARVATAGTRARPRWVRGHVGVPARRRRRRRWWRRRLRRRLRRRAGDRPAAGASGGLRHIGRAPAPAGGSERRTGVSGRGVGASSGVRKEARHAAHVPQEFPDPAGSAAEHQQALLVPHHRREARPATHPQQHRTSYDIGGFARNFRLATHPSVQGRLTAHHPNGPP